MPTLYLDKQGAVLKKKSQRIIVEKDGEQLLEVPIIKIDQIVIFGNVQITAQALSLLLNNQIEVALLSYGGKLLGQLTPIASKNVPLRFSQYQKYQDKNFKVTLSRIILFAKIKNQLTTLRRYLYYHKELNFKPQLQQLADCLNQIEAKNTVPTLMGLEGYASQLYFSVYGQCFLKELTFTTRSRRPPKDEVNALLSLTYTLLGNEILWLLDAVGFDPYIGFFHGIEYGRPSLALDLLEEFRAPIADNFILTLCNNKVFQKKDFTASEGGIILNEEGRKKYFTNYEKKLTAEFSYNGVKTTYRKIFQQQVQKLNNYLTKGSEYEPYILQLK